MDKRSAIHELRGGIFGILMFSAVSAAGQSADWLEFSTIPPKVTVGEALDIAIYGFRSDGLLASNWQAQASVRSYSQMPTTPAISEIDAAGEAIEITNPGNKPVDVSDWELQVFTDYGGIAVAPNARLRIPVGTVLPPLGVMTWTSQGNPPGSFPIFVSSKRFNSPSSFRLARIYDTTGRIVDEVYFRASVNAPEDALWRGIGLANFPSSVTFQRMGYVNHFRSEDWATNSPSLGIANANLALPWSHAGSWSDVTPSTIQISNGVWTGAIVLPQTAGGTNVLWADDGAGLSGASQPFEVVRRPALSLFVPPELLPASESQAGLVGQVTVSLPAVSTSNLVVTLSLGDTNEFAMPTYVLVAAGTSNAAVTVTNLNDELIDGMAQITLIASAGGYEPATAVLLNADDEQGQLTLILPSPLKEDSGFIPEPGRVFLSESARHDVYVHLIAEAPLELPPFIVVPAGRLSQSFSLRVGNDQLANPYNWQVKVWATTESWPQAEGAIQLTDDEGSGFSLSLPTVMVEGTPAIGQILVTNVHAADTVFTLTTNTSRLVVPSQVILPAGSMSVDFSIQTPDNLQPDNQVTVQICAQTPGAGSVCKSITVADDEVTIDRMTIGNPPNAVFAGRAFPIWAGLMNAAGYAQITNVFGEISLLVSPSIAQLWGVTNPIYFTNGVWPGDIAVTGEALDVQLRVAAAGHQTNSSSFDILTGREVALTFNDAVWHSGFGKFLVTLPPQGSVPARLTEIDPYTGQSGRSLDLPRSARRIALSDDGTVAWLASMQSTLQRVDLLNWQFDQEFQVDTGTTNTDSRDLVVLPGETERIVVVANINNTGWRVVLFDNGVGFTNRAALPGSVTSLALVSGRNSGEVFCQSFGFLGRFLVASNAITLARSTNISSSSIEWPSLVLSSGLLYRGYGDVYHPDTLEKVSTFATLNSVVGCPFPERGTMLFVEQNSILKSYDLITLASLANHSLPASVGAPLRLMRWSARGLASFTLARTNLVFFETPLVSTNAPDLVLTVSAPEVAVLPTNGGSPASFSWQFGVTNRGSTAALGVRLQMESGELFELGTMAPGEGTVVNVQRSSYHAQIFSARVTATCALSDSSPQDNTLTAVTRVMRPDLPSSKQLILGMTHLIGSPNGDHLYASVAKSAGEIEDGVAVVNPETASIEQMLSVGDNPQHLAISDDGAKIYVQLGTNVIVRWNLVTGTNEITLRFTNEAVLDFAPVPASLNGLVVATTARVTVFDNAQPRPVSFNGSIDRRHLGYAQGTLWVAEPGQLRPFALTASGLSAGAPVAFTLFSDYYRFASDGRYLFFSGSVFDTVSRIQVNNSFMGDQFCVDAGNDSLFSPVGACLRSYSLSTYVQRAEQCLPQVTSTWLQDPVRWGADGLAVRSSDQQLIIVRSPLVPTNVVTDLSVSIVTPSQHHPYETSEWTVTLTNRSNQSASRVLLTVGWGDLRDMQLEGPVSLLSGASLICDLGTMPPLSAVTFRLRGWTFGGDFTTSASVQSAGTDVSPADNSASVTVNVRDVLADLGIHSVTTPARVVAGEEFDAAFVFTNAGPETANTTFLELIGHGGVDFVGVVSGAGLTNDGGLLLGPIAAGESKTAIVRYRTQGPGFFLVSAYAQGNVYDDQYGNQKGASWTYAAPSNANQVVTEFIFPSSLLAWDTSRQQLLAAFPNDIWSLFVLNPATLEPVAVIPLPTTPEYISPCNNHRHVWVSQYSNEGARVDLLSNSVDQFFTYDPAQTPVRALSAVPGQSNILLAAIDPGWTGNDRVQAFDNGVPLPATHGGLGWMGGGASIHFTPDGRLFVATTYHLRELRLVANGLQEIRNLDALGEYNENYITSATNRLFYKTGKVVDLTSSTASLPLGYVPYLAADPETSLAYLSPPSKGSGVTLSLGCYDAQTMQSKWQLPIPIPVGDTSLGSIQTMGTNGVILNGGKMRLVKTSLLGTPAADLGVSVGIPAVVGMPGLNFPIQIAVTNASVWTAKDAQLDVILSSGLMFADGYPGAGTNHITLSLGNLGELNSFTNLTLTARALTDGISLVQVLVTNALPDGVTGNNSAQGILTVMAAPVFLFDNPAVAEGSSSRPTALAAWLSRPAPAAVSVTFSVTPVSALASDFNSLNSSFQFAAGQQKATSSVIKGDSVPELDETATLYFVSTNSTLSRTSALIVILNDDRPVLTVTNVSVNEGNSGRSDATVRFSLSAKCPFPVDVFFRTVPVTATADVDFIPREGWIRFATNEDVRLISVPVLGDTIYEPSESVAFALLDKVNLDFPASLTGLTIRNDDLPPRPQIFSSSVPGGGLRFDLDTVFGATYRLQSRTNFTTDSWRLLAPAVVGDGGPAYFSLPNPSGPENYYRIMAQ